MSIETDIVALLDGDTTLTNLIGRRLYPDIAPENTDFPCALYEITTGEANLSMTGADPLTRCDMTITAYARRDANGRASVIAIRDRLKTLLHGYRLANPTGSKKLIHGIFYTPAESGYTPDMKLYYESLDFEIHYNE